MKVDKMPLPAILLRCSFYFLLEIFSTEISGHLRGLYAVSKVPF